MKILPPWVTGSKRRSAQTFIEWALRGGHSGNWIVRALRASNLGYRTSEIYRDIRYWKEMIERGSRMKYMPRFAVPSAEWYMPSKYALGARWMTRVRVDLRNVLTGEEKARYPWVAHTHMEAGVEVPDTALTKTRAEIEEAAIRAVKESGYPRAESEEWEVVGVRPLYGLYNPYW